MNMRILTLVFGLSLSFAAPQAWALFGGNNNALEKRVARLEQLLQRSNQADMVMQLEQLQREIQQLRGELEIQGHALDAMKRRQNDLYSDLDQRLKGQVGGSAAASADGSSLAGQSAPAIPPLQLDAPSSQSGGGEGLSTSVQASAPSQIADPHQEAAYRASFEQLKKGEYQNATVSFKSFLAAYPRGPYADKAQYWLGEAFYVMQDYDSSLAEFGKLVKNYSYSLKVPDALLKMGLIQYEKQNWAEARAYLTKVSGEYPSSSAAGQAKKRLDLMRQEGH